MSTYTDLRIIVDVDGSDVPIVVQGADQVQSFPAWLFDPMVTYPGSGTSVERVVLHTPERPWDITELVGRMVSGLVNTDLTDHQEQEQLRARERTEAASLWSAFLYGIML